MQIAAGEPGSAQPHAVKAGPGKAGIIKGALLQFRPGPVKAVQCHAGKIIVAERAVFDFAKRLEHPAFALQPAPRHGAERTVQQPGIFHGGKAEHHAGKIAVVKGTGVEAAVLHPRAQPAAVVKHTVFELGVFQQLAGVIIGKGLPLIKSAFRHQNSSLCCWKNSKVSRTLSSSVQRRVRTGSLSRS